MYDWRYQNTAVPSEQRELRSNRLYHVWDAVTSANYSDDIDDQGAYGTAAGQLDTSTLQTFLATANYAYDELGNLIRDRQEEIPNIEWTVYGKIKAVTRTGTSTKPDLAFGYDAGGNRLWKKVTPKGAGEVEKIYYYLRDAQGNEMCRYVTYTNASSETLFISEEHSLYGSARIGVDGRKDTLYKAGAYTPACCGTQSARRELGHKQYELTNHLRNVLASISDKKAYKTLSGSIFFEAEIITLTDYYPFGSAMQTRGFAAGGYRFGFNTQERETEIGSDIYTAQFWEYDGSVIHRWNIDPRPHPSFGLFSINQCNPIKYSDPLGDTIIVNSKGYIMKNDNKDKLVFVFQNNALTPIGEIGKTVNIDNIYSNLLAENAKIAKGIMNPFTFRDLVKAGGEWDLKVNENTIWGLAKVMTDKGLLKQTQYVFQGYSMEEQDVGNHHFGVVGKAYGWFPEVFMLRMAGAAQVRSGTSRPEWQRYKTDRVPTFTKNDRLIWVEERTMLPPYGDDPRDQRWIKAGFQYFDRNTSVLLK